MLAKHQSAQAVAKAKIIGHRGAGFLRPENSLIAMEFAKQQGINCVEFDVQITADDNLVIHHDNDLQRLADQNLLIANTNLAMIRQIDIGKKFALEYKNTYIPTLAEMLQHCAKLELAINVEIKINDMTRVVSHVEKTLASITHHWPNNLPLPLVSSFSIDALYRVHKLKAPYPLGLLLHEWRDDWLSIANEIDCISVHLNKSIVNQERIKAIKDTGRYVLCYTVDEIEEAEQLFSAGIDSIFTNNIVLLKQHFLTS